jgi:hypothetical protein
MPSIWPTSARVVLGPPDGIRPFAWRQPPVEGVRRSVSQRFTAPRWCEARAVDTLPFAAANPVSMALKMNFRGLMIGAYPEVVVTRAECDGQQLHLWRKEAACQEDRFVLNPESDPRNSECAH